MGFMLFCYMILMNVFVTILNTTIGETDQQEEVIFNFFLSVQKFKVVTLETYCLNIV